MTPRITTPSTAIPNVVFDEWMPILGQAEFKVVMVIARQTFGWISEETGGSKARDQISYTQFQGKTGMKNAALTEAITSLEDRGYVLITDANGRSLPRNGRHGKRLYYSINTTLPENGRVTVSLNSSGKHELTLPENGRTKETITKENNENGNFVSAHAKNPPKNNSASVTTRNAIVKEKVTALPIATVGSEEFRILAERYFREYMSNLGYEHPYLAKTQQERCYAVYLDFQAEFDVDEGNWADMLAGWFISNIETDFNFNHFMTEGILVNRFY